MVVLGINTKINFSCVQFLEADTRHKADKEKKAAEERAGSTPEPSLTYPRSCEIPSQPVRAEKRLARQG